MKIDNPYTLYREARAKTFAVFNKYHNYDYAKKCIDSSDLNVLQKKGLTAELIFFELYKDKYKLTPALDHGDKTDFMAKIDGLYSNIDVTTDLSYKNEQDYEKFQKEGRYYWLVQVNTNNKDTIFKPLFFPKCKNCNETLYTSAHLQSPTQKMYSTQSFGIPIYSFCPSCGKSKIIKVLKCVMGRFDSISDNYDDDDFQDAWINHGNYLASQLKKIIRYPLAYISEKHTQYNKMTDDEIDSIDVCWKNQWALDIKEIDLEDDPSELEDFLPGGTYTFYSG